MSYGVSNHCQSDYFFSGVFRLTQKKTLKLHITGRCEGNPPTADELSSQGSSTTESIPVCLIMVLCRDHVWVAFNHSGESKRPIAERTPN